MRIVDLQTWPRRAHYEMYRAFDFPHFSLCGMLEVSALQAWRAKADPDRRASFSLAVSYVLTRVANALPEFRYRIRGEQVIEHERVDPSLTQLTDQEVFSFCRLRYVEDFGQFVALAAPVLIKVRQQATLDDEGADDLLFLSNIPWVAFTAMQHPIHMHPVDSVPRLTWGKVMDGRMPLGVQVHHGLMDGLHVGRYFEQVQDLLAEPQIWWRET